MLFTRLLTITQYNCFELTTISFKFQNQNRIKLPFVQLDKYDNSLIFGWSTTCTSTVATDKVYFLHPDLTSILDMVLVIFSVVATVKVYFLHSDFTSKLVMVLARFPFIFHVTYLMFLSISRSLSSATATFEIFIWHFINSKTATVGNASKLICPVRHFNLLSRIIVRLCVASYFRHKGTLRIWRAVILFFGTQEPETFLGSSLYISKK